MTRSPLFLAALASSAVPGLDPALVAGVPVGPADPYEVAHITDSQDRRWVIKAPRTQAAGAMLEGITALSTLVGRRLDVAIPTVRGHVVVPEGRAVVYPRVPGRPLAFARLPGGAGLAGEVGRTLAHIHNLDIALMEEADRPSYDAEAHRSRRLTELDRAAATGHVPTGLLARWERSLEDVSMWRFAPTAVHGSYTGDHVLASFDDDSDASTGHVRGVLAWEQSRVADPADDLAALVAQAPSAALDAVLEAYSQSRVERPDPNLLTRGRLAAEMSLVSRLLAVLSAGQLSLVEQVAEELRALDERSHVEEERRAREGAARQQADRARRQAAADRQAEADRHLQDARQVAPARQAEAEPHGASQGAAVQGPGPEPGRPVDATTARSMPDDATQPHNPFPTTDQRAGDLTAAAADQAPGALPDAAADAPAADAPDAERAATAPAQPGLRPVAFEEAAGESPDEDDPGVLDLHEGASDFVAVRQPHGGPPADGSSVAR